MRKKFIMMKFAMYVGTAVLCGVSASLSAQPVPKDYPNKPIRVVVPSQPGGPPDLIIRMLAPKLSAARLAKPSE